MKLLSDRVSVIGLWPLFFFIDIGIAWSGVQTWTQARIYSRKELLRIWNQNAKQLSRSRP